MHLEDDQLHFRATHLSTYSACQHATLLERAVAAGNLDRPQRNDPAIRLLAERGVQHENRYRALLEARHGEPVFRVPGTIPKTTEQWSEATKRTLEAMRAGHRVIYQAPLARAGWHGLADFLVRVPHAAGEEPNVLGDYHHEVVDTKLAQEARGSAILQLCVYSEIVSGLQGTAPEHLVVASPAGVTAPGESPGEADRYAIDGTFHYLLGWVAADDGGKSAYQGLWSKNRPEERTHFERFVDLLVERRQRHPDLHVYHFAPMEKTALGELAARYASREEAVDDLEHQRHQGSAGSRAVATSRRRARSPAKHESMKGLPAASVAVRAR
jgi:predicted RecB family nuclease